MVEVQVENKIILGNYIKINNAIADAFNDISVLKEENIENIIERIIAIKKEGTISL